MIAVASPRSRARTRALLRARQVGYLVVKGPRRAWHHQHWRWCKETKTPFVLVTLRARTAVITWDCEPGGCYPAVAQLAEAAGHTVIWPLVSRHGSSQALLFNGTCCGKIRGVYNPHAETVAAALVANLTPIDPPEFTDA